jgi:hypothetical protein
VPQAGGSLAPLRSRRCFHWPRQLASIERLRHWLPAGSPAWIASGAGLGALRGEALVGDGAARLAQLDRPSAAGAASADSAGFGDAGADQIVL